MEELVTIQMTPEEYYEYRNYQKLLKELQFQDKQKDDMIATTRDMYVKEFEERQSWAKRAVKAEKKLDELVKIMHSSMPAKLRLETLSFELEEAYKDRGNKYD